MKIYFDENMPFAKRFFSELGEVIPFSGRDLTAGQIADADVLLVRSITQVDQQLLAKNNKLSFVGTATIGVDHIDQAYLASRNLAFYSAPGCNAVSVAEYVLSSLVVLAERYLLNLASLTIGIVGAGNTGTQLTKKLDALGINYLICDPLLAKSGDTRVFSSLEDVLKCDVISLHVPLTTKGENATYHLLNEQRLTTLSEEQILINACRGEVIDNHFLLKMKQSGHQIKLVLDVWENEPNILYPLIEYTEISTAHIAGYSLEGKARGTEMLYLALCKMLNKPAVLSLAQLLPAATIVKVDVNQKLDDILLNQMVKMVYDVRRDDAIFRQHILTQGFDSIRKNYPTRREFSAVSVKVEKSIKCDVYHRLGFNY